MSDERAWVIVWEPEQPGPHGLFYYGPDGDLEHAAKFDNWYMAKNFSVKYVIKFLGGIKSVVVLPATEVARPQARTLP